MKHITCHADDVPRVLVLTDQRRNPDRRAVWRGGRRDADWRNRPIGAWVRADIPRERAAPHWVRLLSALHVW